jgi:hypothetical protein
VSSSSKSSAFLLGAGAPCLGLAADIVFATGFASVVASEEQK